jgi:hypothetical protein
VTAVVTGIFVIPMAFMKVPALPATLLKRWDDIFGGDVFLAEPSPAVLQQETLPAQKER